MNEEEITPIQPIQQPPVEQVVIAPAERIRPDLNTKPDYDTLNSKRTIETKQGDN